MFIVKKFVFHTPYSEKYDSSHIYVIYTCISSHRKKKTRKIQNKRTMLVTIRKILIPLCLFVV